MGFMIKSGAYSKGQGGKSGSLFNPGLGFSIIEAEWILLSLPLPSGALNQLGLSGDSRKAFRVVS